MAVAGDLESALAAHFESIWRPGPPRLLHIVGPGTAATRGTITAGNGTGKTVILVHNLRAVLGLNGLRPDQFSGDALRSVEGKLDEDTIPEQWARVVGRLSVPRRRDRFWSIPPVWTSRARSGSSADCRLFRPRAVLVTVARTMTAVDLGAAAALMREQWINLVKRVDSAALSILQRVVLASRWMAASPDSPPGEIVVSSARVPRGPDSPRVTSALVPRAERFVLA